VAAVAVVVVRAVVEQDYLVVNNDDQEASSLAEVHWAMLSRLELGTMDFNGQIVCFSEFFKSHSLVNIFLFVVGVLRVAVMKTWECTLISMPLRGSLSINTGIVDSELNDFFFQFSPRPKVSGLA
jgi:hypothetical protein